jgi:chitin synthase
MIVSSLSKSLAVRFFGVRVGSSLLISRSRVDYEAEALDYPEHKSVSGDSHPRSRAHSFAPVPGFQTSHSRPGSHSGSALNSPHSAGGGGGGDYYQNTNLTHNNSSNPNLRLPHQGPLSHLNPSASSRGGSVTGHTVPQLPAMPYGGSISDHGGMGMGMNEFGAMPGFGGYAGSTYGGSGYGGTAPAAPRNSVMTNLNMFGGGGGGGGGVGSSMSMSGMSNMGMGMGPGMGFGSMNSNAPPSAFPPSGGFGSQHRPISSFSMATSINPFMNPPSTNANPTDEELLGVLRVYLGTQDLMTVTKK